MADSGTPKAGRDTLRDTAKWMVSGIPAAITLIVGSSTFSQLGGMPIGPRFWFAVAALAAAAVLSCIPFMYAVAVLRSDLQSLGHFVAAQLDGGVRAAEAPWTGVKTDDRAMKGDLKQAANAVDVLMAGQFAPQTSVADFQLAYKQRRGEVWAADQTAKKETAKAELANLATLRDTAREACLTQLVAIRFARLYRSMLTIPLILLLFVAFTWAANPAKDSKPGSKAIISAGGVNLTCDPAWTIDGFTTAKSDRLETESAPGGGLNARVGKLAQSLQMQPGDILLIGSTDPRRFETNAALALQRAQTVQALLDKMLVGRNVLVANNRVVTYSGAALAAPSTGKAAAPDTLARALFGGGEASGRSVVACLLQPRSPTIEITGLSLGSK